MLHTLAMVRFVAGPQAAAPIAGMASGMVGALWSGRLWVFGVTTLRPAGAGS